MIIKLGVTLLRLQDTLSDCSLYPLFEGILLIETECMKVCQHLFPVESDRLFFWRIFRSRDNHHRYAILLYLHS